MSKRWYYTGDHGFIKHHLENLKEYVNTFENILKKELSNFTASVEEEAAKLEEEEKDNYYDYHSTTHWQLTEVFPSILINSLFVSAYSILETNLIDMCDNLQKKNKYSMLLSDIKGKGIFLAQTYFKKVVGIQFPDQGDTWKTILKYNLIRNVLVHKEGKLFDDDKSRQIATYIENNSTLSLDKYCRIQLTYAFIREVIDVLNDFFNELFDAIESKTKEGLVL